MSCAPCLAGLCEHPQANSSFAGHDLLAVRLLRGQVCAGRKLMACLSNHSKARPEAAGASTEYLVPYTTRLAMPDAMTLRLDFTGHDRVLGEPLPSPLTPCFTPP